MDGGETVPRHRGVNAFRHARVVGIFGIAGRDRLDTRLQLLAQLDDPDALVTGQQVAEAMESIRATEIQQAIGRSRLRETGASGNAKAVDVLVMHKPARVRRTLEDMLAPHFPGVVWSLVEVPEDVVGKNAKGGRPPAKGAEEALGAAVDALHGTDAVAEFTHAEVRQLAIEEHGLSPGLAPKTSQDTLRRVMGEPHNLDRWRSVGRGRGAKYVRQEPGQYGRRRAKGFEPVPIAGRRRAEVIPRGGGGVEGASSQRHRALP